MVGIDSQCAPGFRGTRKMDRAKHQISSFHCVSAELELAEFSHSAINGATVHKTTNKFSIFPRGFSMLNLLGDLNSFSSKLGTVNIFWGATNVWQSLAEHVTHVLRKHFGNDNQSNCSRCGHGNNIANKLGTNITGDIYADRCCKE
eukprot:3646769-Amphidinium_carterae.2